MVFEADCPLNEVRVLNPNRPSGEKWMTGTDRPVYFVSAKITMDQTVFLRSKLIAPPFETGCSFRITRFSQRAYRNEKSLSFSDLPDHPAKNNAVKR